MNKEDILQKSVADYLRLQYPKILFCHIANERQTSPQRGSKLKKMGVRKGMPDLLIFKQRNVQDKCYTGLAIELKIKPNKPSVHQIEVLNQLSKVGWAVKICYSFEEACNTINTYLGK